MLFQYNKNISGAFVAVCCIISLVNITSNIKGLKLSVSSTDTTNTQQNEGAGRESFEDEYNQSVKYTEANDTEYSDWMQVGDKSFRVAKAAIMDGDAADEDAIEDSSSVDKNPVEEEPECHVCRKNKSELGCNLEQWHSGHEETKTVEHTELVCADCKEQWLDVKGTCPMCRVQIAEPVAEKAEEYEDALLEQEELEEDQEELEWGMATTIQQWFLDARSPLGLRAAQRARDEAFFRRLRAAQRAQVGADHREEEEFRVRRRSEESARRVSGNASEDRMSMLDNLL